MKEDPHLAASFYAMLLHIFLGLKGCAPDFANLALYPNRDTEGTRPLKEEYRKELVGLLRQGLIEDLDPQLLLDTEKRA